MLNNQYALITGASSGIGKELAISLAKRGWNLILVARRLELLEKLKLQLESEYKIKVQNIKADLCNDSELNSVKKSFDEFDITFLINNAGVMRRGSFHEVDFKINKDLIGLNVTALTDLTHTITPYFLKSKSPCYILNVGSLNSYISTAGTAAYCGSKAFVKSFSLAVNEELKGTNVSCTCLCPGGTKSEILLADGIKADNKTEKMMMDADTVAEIAINATFNRKAVVIPGVANIFSVLSSKIIPETWMTKLASKILAYFIG